MMHTMTPIVLVLLHVLGPGLHWAQHAAAALSGGGAAAASHCGHASCSAKAAVPHERAQRARGLEANEREDQQHDHDCALCSQLHRLHGYVAPSVDLQAAALAVVGQFTAVAQVAPDAARPTLPPARAPPVALA